MEYAGSCHCGNITVTLETAISPDKLELRKCVCTFCIKHGAISATDPNGSFQIRVANEADLSRYRFGLRTAEFVVCSLCGTYLAALLSIEDKLYSTVNVNALTEVDKFTMPPKRVNFENETAMERVSRRQEKWTPTTIEIGK